MARQDDRPEIPDEVKRIVRQRCGFGCVLCGHPFYEYDHMRGWRKTGDDPDWITLLCRQHHGEKTNLLLPLADVERANADPHNRREGVSRLVDLHYSGTSFEVQVGTMLFDAADLDQTGGWSVLAIDGTDLLRFDHQDGELLLSLLVVDQFNQPQFVVWENELVFTVEPWDIEVTKNRIVLREGLGLIWFDIRFEAPDKVTIERGSFRLNGVELFVTPQSVVLLNECIYLRNWNVGNIGGDIRSFLALGVLREPALIGHERVDRFNWDRAAAMNWARAENKRLVVSDREPGRLVFEGDEETG